MGELSGARPACFNLSPTLGFADWLLNVFFNSHLLRNWLWMEVKSRATLGVGRTSWTASSSFDNCFPIALKLGLGTGGLLSQLWINVHYSTLQYNIQAHCTPRKLLLQCSVNNLNDLSLNLSQMVAVITCSVVQIPGNVFLIGFWHAGLHSLTLQE